MAERIIEHHGYLNDRPRMDAYARAIAAIVKPGDVVMDLGAGTGIFGVLAARAGARRIYSVDGGGMIEVARMIARANGVADRFVFMKGMSNRVDPGEPIDVVIADQAASFVFQAGVFEYFADARRRFLKPGGHFIPYQFDLMLAPIENDELRGHVGLWQSPVHGVDVTPGAPIAANDWYDVHFKPADLIGPPTVLASIESSDDRPFRGEVELPVDRNGTIHGIGGFFRARLAPGIDMSSSPLDPAPIGRNTIFFPIERAVAVTAGDRIRTAFSVDPVRQIYGWTVSIADRDGVGRYRSSHSTFRGAIVAQEELDRSRPSFIPALSARDAARRTILDLCDGVRTVAEIEAEVARRHPECFPASADASALVALVIGACELRKDNDDSRK